MMERLTDPGYIPERVVANMSNEQLANMYKKLCSYEITEIEPEQISVMMAHNTALIERLADYEDAPKINAIEVPCMPGDIVYMLKNQDGKYKIEMKKVRNIKIFIHAKGYKNIEVWFDTSGFCFEHHFGRSVFLDKSEAFNALFKKTAAKEEECEKKI